MSLFKLIAAGIDVSPLLAQIDAHPGLWNARAERRVHPESPHRETDDLWLRYRHPRELTGPASYAEPHNSVWYPASITLAAAWPIIDRLRDRVGADALGGVLMTRIPPGARVHWHDDRGTWHAEHYTMKIWLPLRANAQCVNSCLDPATDHQEDVIMQSGEAWTFSNLLPHRVLNLGDTERIALIMCFRCEP